MIDLKQLRRYIVTPVNDRIGMGGFAADALVIGTGVVESGYYYIDQAGRGAEQPGPAFGPWQMERATHDWLWETMNLDHPFFRARKEAFSSLCIGEPSAEQMQGNWYYAAAMCRLRYWVCPFHLPADPGAEDLAALWKHWYNTPAGAGSEQAASVEFARVLKVLRG